jgi:ribosomal protein L21E
MTFKQYFEGTVSADIAGTSGGFKKECPCKTDPESEECKEIQKKKLDKPIKESRPTRISNIFLDLDKCNNFQLIDMHATYSGFVGLVRYKDGNAYEINIIPAEKSKEFPEYTKG